MVFLLLTEEKYKNFLASELFLARKKSKLTQDNVADILVDQYKIRANRTTIAKYENGLQTPPLYTLQCLSNIYNCEIINFFHNINNDKNYLAYGGEHISAKKENLLKQIAEKNIPDAILDLIQNAIEQY